jgi:hypothetical protein
MILTHSQIDKRNSELQLPQRNESIGGVKKPLWACGPFAT